MSKSTFGVQNDRHKMMKEKMLQMAATVKEVHSSDDDEEEEIHDEEIYSKTMQEYISKSMLIIVCLF